MIDTVLTVLEHLIKLVKYREKSDRQLYEDFVAPTICALEKLHQNYLETFLNYRREIEAKTYNFTDTHPVFNIIKLDALYSAHLRSQLTVITNFRNDPFFGKLFSTITQYLNLASEDMLFGSLEKNVRREFLTFRLSIIFKTSCSEGEKQREGLLLVDNMVEALQRSYDEVIKENIKLRKKALDRRI